MSLSPDRLRSRRTSASQRRQVIRRRRIGAGVALLVVILGATVLANVSLGGGSSNTSGGHRATSGGSPSAPSSQGEKVVTFTVEASGDLLIHSPVWERALELGGGNHYNFAALFTQIKPYIVGTDLPLCHVETPMGPGPPAGYPVFNTPAALADGIKATGFKVCSTAATHTLDQGQAGVDGTNRALDRVGVVHTGSFSSAQAQQTPLIVNVKGIKVAFLSYTDITNGIPSPRPWSVNRASAPAILDEARRATRAGARAVIVNIHWGDENVTEPSGRQMALARTLTASPLITAVVGQHVHVVQPIRTINGKLVVFGEGNLISNQTDACCPTAAQDGLIALLTIRVDQHGARVTFVHYVPIWVRHPDFTVLPAGTAISSDSADADALRASYLRTVRAAGRTFDIQPVPAVLPPPGR